ncbi:regulation of nuclear pre-mRNA domain-containing protein 1B-like [Diadema antillarum]|uniref:regulation of nuclear pre-mRNA domain-containing protein 1B-like n=1 Tax=Diadema antillarum TaxID=105358 RepID=UPI003A86E7B9
MSSFTEKALIEKLNSLTNTQQSIQTMSLWLIHHRKHAKKIVTVWYTLLVKAKPSRKLGFVYLANDVVQNSKKKGPEFNREFAVVMPASFGHIYDTTTDEKTYAALQKVLKVWKDRSVFDKEVLKKIESENTENDEDVPEQDVAEDASTTPPQRPNNSETEKEDVVPSKKPKMEVEDMQRILEEEDDQLVEIDDIPEPEELAQALRELENSASSDAAVREKIAKLPPEVQDISLLEKIKDKEAAEELSSVVNEAVSMLSEYNSRLSAEMIQREAVMKMLKNYRLGQQMHLKTSLQKLEEYKDRLTRVTTVRKELTSHIQNLPDLSLLPDVTGGLAPLPSAGDLFSIDS